MRGNFVRYVAILFVISLNNCVYSSNPKLYTKEENKALEKFRPLVSSYLKLNYQKTDAYLLRWLRNNKLDLSSAKQDLIKYFDWRQKYGLDSILDSDQFIPKNLPFTVDGVDKSGHLIAFCPVGRWGFRKYVLAGKGEVVLTQFRRLYETAIKKTFEIAELERKDLDQMYVIFDLLGYNARDHTCLACVALTLDMARIFLSGSIPFSSNIVLVNAPRIFLPVLGLAKAIIGDRVLVEDFDNNKVIWKEKLFKDIDPGQLPQILGGTKLE